MNTVSVIHYAKALQALYAGDLPPTIIATSTDTQVRVEQISTRRYCILFPGSASLRDALTDVMIRKVRWGRGKVHHGFAVAFRSVADAILGAVPPGSAVVIAGHSLGGALATLCADAFQDSFDLQAVFTFGSPRVGNGRFAGEYNQRLAVRTFRIVNAGDPVPWSPLPLPTFTSGRYTHVGLEHYLNRDGGVEIEPWAITHLGDALGGAGEKKFFAADHSLAAYLRKLEALT